MERKGGVEKEKYSRIRILSILAILLLAAICIVGVLLILSNPGLTLLYLIAGVGLLFGVWLMFSAKGYGFWLGVVLEAFALAAIVAATIAFFAQSKNSGRFLVLVGLAIVYLALAGYISRLYWQARRAQAQVATTSENKPVLIINPKSGNGRALKARLADKARSAGIAVVMLEPGQDMVRLAEQAIEQGSNVLGVSGGDGSLGVMAKIAMKHNIPLVVLPGGTRCHFARDIGLDPNRITDALAGFEGVERRVDVGQIGDRIFLNNASFGLYAEITSNEEYREHKVETSRRVIRQLASSSRPYYPLRFKDGAGNTWKHAALVLVGVNRYELLHLGELGERKRLDEGVLQVIAVGALNDQTLKQLATRKRLGGEEQELLTEWTTTTFTIAHPSGLLRVGLDGENVQLSSPVEVHIQPKALRLLVPAEGVRHRPIKPISATGARTLRDLILAKDSYGSTARF